VFPQFARWSFKEGSRIVCLGEEISTSFVDFSVHKVVLV
jgi:hypothetical protein